jgi:hypothetical protein
MMLPSKRRRRRRLRLLIRDEYRDDDDDSSSGSSKSTSNLFVRLSPGVARDLMSLTMRDVPTYDSSRSVPQNDLSWQLETSSGNDTANDDSDPTFLPLSIVFNGGCDGNESNTNECTIYASYNGGTCSGRIINSINDGTCIQIKLSQFLLFIAISILLVVYVLVNDRFSFMYKLSLHLNVSC